MTNADSFRQDSLQVLSERLQQLNDISSRFDALTKETEEKLHNVIETADVLQQKMSPINEKMEALRTRRRGYESCRLFLKQTNSYQVTTEKYIQEIGQSKIVNVEDYTNSLSKAKESLDFFMTYLPQEKSAENLQYIIAEGSRGLKEKFKEQLTAMSQSARLQPEKCLGLAGESPVNLKEFLPKFRTDDLQELQLITDWLDSQGKAAEYVQIYIEVRSLSLCSTLKKFRDSLLGYNSTAFGASPSVARRGGPKDTPTKATLHRRISVQDASKIVQRSASVMFLDRRKSKTTTLAQQPTLGVDTADQPDLDADDANALMTAFLRLAALESLVLPMFNFKLERPLQLVDHVVAKSKEAMFEDIHSFAATVRREFKQDPESLLRLVSLLDRLRRLRRELSAAGCPPALRSAVEDLAKEARAQARGSLEDYRDDIVREGGSGFVGGGGGPGSGGPGGGAEHPADVAAVEFQQQQQRLSLPPDGTVHELTLKALKFLHRLHGFSDTVYDILAREPATSPGGGGGGGAGVGTGLSSEAASKAKAKVLGAYLSQTLANLLRNLDHRSEQYSDPALRAIFLLNNYRYVQQRLERDGMTATIQAYNFEAVRFFEEHQAKNRQSYLNRGLQRCAAPLELATRDGSAAATVGNSSSSHSSAVGFGRRASSATKHASGAVVKLSDKEKALIKEKFKSFNEEFQAVHKTQANYSVPDAELRLDLIRENKAFLLDKYAFFRDKYANVPFTSKKEKYIKFTREDVDRMLDDFFRGQ